MKPKNPNRCEPDLPKTPGPERSKSKEALVVWHVLREQGWNFDLPTVTRWMLGTEPIDGRVTNVVKAVLHSYPHYLAVLTLAMLDDPSLAKAALDACLEDPVVLKAAIDTRAEVRAGYYMIVPRVLLTREEYETFELVRKAARWKRATLMTRLVQLLTGAVVERLEEIAAPSVPAPEDTLTVKLAKQRRRKVAVQSMVVATEPTSGLRQDRKSTEPFRGWDTKVCECGAEIKVRGEPMHKTSKRHQEWLAKQKA